ncbi:oxygenase MpaB family protein [Nonomuraea aurantiaca]|uniref:oxygenase MpaB family protein n=1 Tax=Nonomuraea aurantiaca TaxID=2878562 RepID=UPI001CD97BD0|nr:oxygenase MpaB family protein [Nonomuraea aurantiaca]MCA2226933.1 DUF2236 domain-containing protein [Nonomuraea aurantiaca]
MSHAYRNAVIPERVVNLDEARHRHGAMADHAAQLVMAGDPLADAVIAELDQLGKEGRRILNRGLAEGLAGLGEEPPRAIEALLRQLETVPSWVDPALLDRGEVALLSVPQPWFEICAISSALVHTYVSPAIARLLAQTGQLTKMASRRLVETGMWGRQSTLPGGLHRGAPGYISTAQVRLLHARVRATALQRGWDTAVWGLPIGQTDMARTWLDFTLTPFTALAAVGIELSAEEQKSLYQYWAYVAYLLGIDERFYQGVTDHAGARRLQNLLDMTNAEPDDNSRALTAAMVSATASAMACAPNPLMAEDRLRDLLHGLLRRAFGTELSDHLGIPESDSTPLLPLVALLNSQARRWQTFTAGSAETARRENAQSPGPDEAFRLPGGTAYEQNIAVPTTA